MRILKFLTTGLMGLSVNLGLFHVLLVSGVPYLYGSISAFLIAIIVGFVLQKYWTFKDSSLERAHTQFAQYVGLALCNLAINTCIVYFLVEYMSVYYLIAQTIGAGLVAIWSYFIYKSFIFTSSS